ncbi:MAG: ParA family protein [Streptococcus sobrinus]
MPVLRHPWPKTMSEIALKGGDGKTTITLLCATRLAAFKLKVLLVDLDSQCNLSHYFDVYQSTGTVANIFTAAGAVEIVSVAPNIDLIPGSMRLDEVEASLATKSNQNTIFYDWLSEHCEELNLEQYDVILIDTHPDFGIITKNAIAVSDVTLTPVAPGKDFSAEGKANLELRLEAYRQEEIMRPSRESLIQAESYFVLNKIAKTKKKSKELLAEFKDDPDVLGIIPEKELFNQDTKDLTIIDMMEDPKIFKEHRNFFVQLKKTLGAIFDVLKLNLK